MSSHLFNNIKNSFLKSYGKFKMSFSCATFTDLSFLITTGNYEGVTKFIQNIQAGYKSGSRVVNRNVF